MRSLLAVFVAFVGWECCGHCGRGVDWYGWEPGRGLFIFAFLFCVFGFGSRWSTVGLACNGQCLVQGVWGSGTSPAAIIVKELRLSLHIRSAP